MSYIIIAEVDTRGEMNVGGDKAKVRARMLDEQDGIITFDVQGDYDPSVKRERVLALCQTLVDAGFVEFSIRHSY
ncbi:hypothetical protein OPIT5_29370 [Opitutaceae bacterium TAV5]|nr:hypothetical protein OPIT5_21750 [Opitutaceae bacterium TAV5]AHF94890.1 hypothetical protein OPIT5_29370 [Opitutaceae bacterium TAV5]